MRATKITNWVQSSKEFVLRATNGKWHVAIQSKFVLIIFSRFQVQINIVDVLKIGRICYPLVGALVGTRNVIPSGIKQAEGLIFQVGIVAEERDSEG